MNKTAAIIGAGFGGLALAIRLQSAGIATTIMEARDKPGGRGYYWEKDGFTFDGGPTVITDPPCLEELWALSGHKMADDIELMPVFPFYRLNWPDGTNFDYSNDAPGLRAEIEKLNPDDVEGYRKFLEYSKGVYKEGYQKLGSVAFLDFASMIKAAPALMKYQAWRSVYSIVSSYVKDEKLREALSFHTLLVGGNPMSTSAICAASMPTLKLRSESTRARVGSPSSASTPEKPNPCTSPNPRAIHGICARASGRT